MNKIHFRESVIPWGLACFMTLASGSTFALDLESVLQKAAVVPPSRVEFREERHNSLLKEPLVLTGYLEYLEAGRLRKVVLSPFNESFLIDDDQIEFQRDGETRKISLKRSKSLRTMLEGIEAILAGEKNHLEETFTHQLSGTDCAWTLQLEPISRIVSQQLTSMVVKGDYASLSSIRVNLKDGEWNLIEISGTAPQP